MEKYSDAVKSGSRLDASLRRPCAGGLRSSKSFDPTAWYVGVVRRRNELVCRRILNNLSQVPYKVEAFVAAQQEVKFYANRTRRLIEHIIIPGRIFIRVDESYRQDVLKQCLFLSKYMMDPSAELTESGCREFARVPDREIQHLRDILELADGIVEYSESMPKTGDRVQVLSGRFHGLTGTVSENADGRKYAVVVLDKLGSFKFRLPLQDIGKIK